MQLARNVTLRGQTLGAEKKVQRKLREIYYTLQIEKRYTKREILTLYANQIWLGTADYSAYGVEAKSRLLFGKSARDLDLAEAAVIAGIIQTPARKSPLVNMSEARIRRNYTLQRMADEGYISQEEADTAKATRSYSQSEPSAATPSHRISSKRFANISSTRTESTGSMKKV